MEMSLYLDGNQDNALLKQMEKALDQNESVGAYYSERKELEQEYGGEVPPFLREQNADIIASVGFKEMQHTDALILLVDDTNTLPLSVGWAIEMGLPLVIVYSDERLFHPVLEREAQIVLQHVNQLAAVAFDNQGWDDTDI